LGQRRHARQRPGRQRAAPSIILLGKLITSGHGFKSRPRDKAKPQITSAGSGPDLIPLSARLMSSGRVTEDRLLYRAMPPWASFCLARDEDLSILRSAKFDPYTIRALVHPI